MQANGTGAKESFKAPCWDLGRLTLQPHGHPLVMGIINLTPDSFHAASRVPALEQALFGAQAMIAAGVDILDLGAESSRPGAAPISATQEQDRLLPVLEALRREATIPISVDTYDAATACLAIQQGADAINDISAGRLDPDMFAVVAQAGCGIILMHMQGQPGTMQQNPTYKNVVSEVRSFLANRVKAAMDAGIAVPRIAVDPGIGFGKNLFHNKLLLNKLHDIPGALPLVLGASRKRFIGEITGAEVAQRLPGSLAALTRAFFAQAALVRVHDVPETCQFFKVLAAIND